MVSLGFCLLVLLTAGYISTISVAIYEIRRVTNRELKVMEKLGWVYVLPPEERQELEDAYLLLKFQKRIFQEVWK